MILVKTFYAFNDLRNYSYLMLDDQTGHSWVIDPYEASPIIDYIKKNNLSLKGILNTHQHFDHIRGNAPLQDAFQAPVCKLKNSETISLGPDILIETLDTPGHTPDHQAFLWKKHGEVIALFSGDTLFNAGVGNCRLGGDVNQLYSTTEKLRNLPEKTLLYPGHDYRKRNLQFALEVEPENREIKERLRAINGFATEDLPPATLAEEKAVNPFLRLDSEELGQNLVKRSGPLSDQERDRRELFVKLRQLRDQW